MKKILIFIIFMLIMPLSVKAVDTNRIYDIDIDVYLNEDGSADITEVWYVDGYDGTEWYKVMNNLNNMELSNFKVWMDNRKLRYKEWNINESLEEKKGYYGIIRTDSGYELCFGKYDYYAHRFILSYKLSNFVFNTEDAQVIYFNFIDRLSNVDFDNFSVTLSSYYSFPNTLDVWGYGYKGYAYVSDGKIKMSNEDDMDGSYAVLLAKFPLNTFSTLNTHSNYATFEDVYKMAEKGTFDYKGLIMWMVVILGGIVLIRIFILVERTFKYEKYGFGYKNDKTINKDSVSFYKSIPCNNDLYYAFVLIKLNDFGYSKINVFKAILFDWYRKGKITIKNNKNIEFNKEVIFDNEAEKKFFELLKTIGKNGILDIKKLERYCIKNHDTFLGIFDEMEKYVVNLLRVQKHIYPSSDGECKRAEIMDEQIYKDSLELYGFKKQLEEFCKTNINNELDIKLFDEYLVFAYLFGISDKFLNSFKNVYSKDDNKYYSDLVLEFIDYIGSNSVNLAMEATKELIL